MGTDVIVGELPDLSNNTAEGVFDAYAVGTTSCNKGNVPLNWFTGGTDNRHPVIGQNLFRLHNGRFEHIGQAWLKHGFTALQGDVCVSQFGFACSSTPGTTLGVGCSDPYSSGLNNGQSGLGPKWQVNAATGLFPYPFDNPSFSGSTARPAARSNGGCEPGNVLRRPVLHRGPVRVRRRCRRGAQEQQRFVPRGVLHRRTAARAPTACTVQPQSACVGTNVWLGMGTACSPTTVCSSASGSCCATNGSCSVTARAACVGCRRPMVRRRHLRRQRLQHH